MKAVSNMSQQDDKKDDLEMHDHNYDGITELDNPLPSWWLWTFFITIIFSFLYYIHYELAGGPSLKQELATAMAEIEKHKALQPVVMESEEMLVAAMKGDGVLNMGAAVYKDKCAVCHGQEVQGQIGPNLTDKYWLHGKGNRMDIIKVIRVGVLDKGMPNWDQILKKEELYAVTAFIHSKQNSNPANAKAPQGELVE